MNEDTNGVYDTYVTKLADTNSSELISNGKTEHARTIIKNLLSHAENKVRIFSGCLNEDIYTDPTVVDALRQFLDTNDARIVILIQNKKEFDKISDNHPFVRQCAANDDKCELFYVVDESDKVLPEHMVVMDERGYRFCPDKHERAAVASFNRPQTARHLASEFDSLASRAVKVKLPREEAVAA